MWKIDEFEQFVKGLFQEQEDRNFILRLPRPLTELNGKRKRAEHPSTKHPLLETDIAVVFPKFMGICCEGILPRLAAIQRRLAESRAKAA